MMARLGHQDPIEGSSSVANVLACRCPLIVTRARARMLPECQLLQAHPAPPDLLWPSSDGYTDTADLPRIRHGPCG